MSDLSALRGQPVAVGRAGGPTPNPFMVDSAIDDTAVLRPTSTEAKGFAASLAVGDTITVGSPSRRGFVCADVVVQRWTPSQRMLLVSNPRSLVAVQRRGFKRVPMTFTVELAIERAGRIEMRRGDGIDLSLGGWAAAVPGEPLTLGEQAAVALGLPDERLLAVVEIVGVAETGRDVYTTRARFTQLLSSSQPALAMALHSTELARVRVAEDAH